VPPPPNLRFFVFRELARKSRQILGSTGVRYKGMGEHGYGERRTEGRRTNKETPVNLGSGEQATELN
jgi:hypothetical protein